MGGLGPTGLAALAFHEPPIPLHRLQGKSEIYILYYKQEYAQEMRGDRMIRILKHFIFTFIVTAIAFAFGCRASDPIPQRISAPIVSVEDIMNDTKAGTQSYEGKIVKVNGTVDYRDQNLLSLETGSSVSTFFINHDKSLNSFYRFKQY